MLPSLNNLWFIMRPLEFSAALGIHLRGPQEGHSSQFAKALLWQLDTLRRKYIIVCWVVTRQITCEFWIWHSVLWNIHQAELQLVAPKILQHTNFTVWLFCPASSSLFTELISTLDWFFTVDWFYPSLFLSSVIHSLKLILCRLEGEHLLEPYRFLVSDTTAASLFITAESHC
jgi:hypothetical protein